ncbi:hypothetical protein C8J57DRAFT_1722591 [Mycena rebaudengoi]|nr:hypothetical protein C8J57DRAFT_1722591 [Mycena rebaudengoi]
MLFPTTPAMALFGSRKDPLVLGSAESLAKTSGFPVVIRPPNDIPITLVSCDNNQGNFERGNQFGESASNTDQMDWEPMTANPLNPEAREGALMKVDKETVTTIQGAGEDDFDRQSNHDDPNDGGFHFGDGGGGGGGGGRGGGTDIDDKWESPLHGTCIKLRLKLKNDPEKYYFISIGYNFKFLINPNTNPPIDRENLSPALSQPEVIALVDFKIENRPRETQVDRSYATIGFVAHREKSIMQREILHRGFDLPDKTYKHGRQVHIQKGLKATLGLASGHPTASATFSYDRNRDSLMEATDNKIMPRCRVHSEIGSEWDKPGKSYTSYNFTYQPQDMSLDPGPEYHPLEVKVGMGINLRPPGAQEPRMSFVSRDQILIWVLDPASKSQMRGIVVLISSYIDNIRRKGQLSIFEQKDVELMTSGTPKPGENDPAKQRDNEPGTVSLLIAKVPPPPNKPGLAGWIPKLGQRTPVPAVDMIPLHEYLARGWDATNEEWREVLWPVLDQDFRAAELEGTSSAWKMEWKWAREAGTKAGYERAEEANGFVQEGNGRAQETKTRAGKGKGRAQETKTPVWKGKGKNIQ